jgi:hypothetical protein
MKLFLIALTLALPQFEGYEPIFKLDCKKEICSYFEIN